MSSALHTRVRSRPTTPAAFDRELALLLPWVPPALRPLMIRLRTWRRRYQAAEAVEDRLHIEQQALADLQRPLSYRPRSPLVDSLIERIIKARQHSLAERRRALAEGTADPQLDRRLFGELLHWLGEQHREPALAAFCSRLLLAWWRERGSDALPLGHGKLRP
ncbi:hypothetical protein [Motiliproteus sp. SC1-56]|uniref:hypothetical protein n=1 Tax=Motiliproteus sp. SC1-56 TaxID=2799565 RepID=UPI001A8C80D3|nr:hypothetical protein [Motiliproteus sp. SC1-56]